MTYSPEDKFERLLAELEDRVETLGRKLYTQEATLAAIQYRNSQLEKERDELLDALQVASCYEHFMTEEDVDFLRSVLNAE